MSEEFESEGGDMFNHVDESYDDNKCVGVCVTLFLFKLVFPFREKLRLKLKSQPGRHSRKLLVQPVIRSGLLLILGRSNFCGSYSVIHGRYGTACWATRGVYREVWFL